MTEIRVNSSTTCKWSRKSWERRISGERDIRRNRRTSRSLNFCRHFTIDRRWSERLLSDNLALGTVVRFGNGSFRSIRLHMNWNDWHLLSLVIQAPIRNIRGRDSPQNILQRRFSSLFGHYCTIQVVDESFCGLSILQYAISRSMHRAETSSIGQRDLLRWS